jgi:rare lipoprotein A
MKRALPLFVPSLTGCVLVASLVFGCPDVDGAQGGRTADGSPLATARTKPRPPSRVQIGLASWYGRRWQGRPTASGERYDRHQLTAAHRTAPLGTQAVVTNLANGYTVRVRINDRGPHTRHRILDLSYEAARRLDMVRTGAARVKVEFLVASLPFA